MNKKYLLLLCVVGSALQARVVDGGKTDHIVVSPLSAATSKKNTVPQELAQWRARKLELDSSIKDLAGKLKITRKLEERSPLIAQWNEFHIKRNQVGKKIMQLQQQVRSAASDSVEQQLVQQKIKRANPLHLLSQLPSEKWELNDADLTFKLSFALRDKSLLDAMLSMREKEANQWMAWREALHQTATKADEMYVPLQSAMLKHMRAYLKEKKLDKRSAEELAEGVIKGHVDYILTDHLGDTSFVTEMVAHIAGSSSGKSRTALEHYRNLFLMVLGCDFELSTFHAKDMVRVIRKKGKPLTDLQTMRCVIAHMLIAYRKAYDKHYHGLVSDMEETFVRGKELSKEKGMGSNDLKTWMVDWRQASYLTPLKSYVPRSTFEARAHQQWQEVLTRARTQAHKHAASAIDNDLADVWDGMRSLHARINILQVPDSAFNYPESGRASNDALLPDQKHSILIGLLARCIEYRMVQSKALGATVLQTVFANEMHAQYSSKHLVEQLPPGANSSHLTPMQAQAMRKSYEGQMYTIIGTAMDVLNGIGEQESRGTFSRGAAYERVPIASALSEFNKPNEPVQFIAQTGPLLYAKIVERYGELNAIMWRLGHTKTSKKLRKELTIIMKEAEDYLATMGIDVTNPDKERLRVIYAGILQRLIPWKKPSDITFKKPASLREQLRSLPADQQVASYQAAYQLMWLCIWQRLSTVINVRSGREVVSRLFAKDTLVSAEALRENQAGGGGDKASATSRISARLQALKDDAKVLPRQLQQIGRGLLTQGKSLKTELVDKFSRTGELSGVVEHMNTMLSQVNAVLPGVNKVLYNVYDQSNSTYGELHDHLKKQSDRLLATLKGLTTYVFYLNQYSTKKITGLQGALSELLNSKMIRFASRLGAKVVGDKIRDVLEKNVEEDERIQRQMRISLDDISEAWAGRRKQNDVTGIPQTSLATMAAAAA